VGTALLFSIFCFTALIAGAAVFQQKVNSARPVWRSLAANSYGIYYFHPLILYPLAYLAVPLDWSVFFKAATIIVLTILLAWGVSALVLKRVPFLRDMF
jgi:peptidoglycan/LPS O-acetylase OafA/YrhL